MKPRRKPKPRPEAAPLRCIRHLVSRRQRRGCPAREFRGLLRLPGVDPFAKSLRFVSRCHVGRCHARANIGVERGTTILPRLSRSDPAAMAAEDGRRRRITRKTPSDIPTHARRMQGSGIEAWGKRVDRVRVSPAHGGGDAGAAALAGGASGAIGSDAGGSVTEASATEPPGTNRSTKSTRNFACRGGG